MVDYKTKHIFGIRLHLIIHFPKLNHVKSAITALSKVQWDDVVRIAKKKHETK